MAPLFLSEIMCRHCYEEYINRTDKIMLVCDLKNDESDELLRLCICQRYCNKDDKYIPYNQKEQCKEYE